MLSVAVTSVLVGGAVLMADDAAVQPGGTGQQFGKTAGQPPMNAEVSNDTDAAANAQPAGAPMSPGGSANVEQMISSWPQSSQDAAKMMMKQYGQPTGVTPSRLVWTDQQPWAEIIVYKNEVSHSFPVQHPDVLEQVIYYQVPADKFDELAQFDGSVIVERTKGTMAARCDKEPANYLALNLAHDIVEGKRSVDEARQMYADTMKKVMMGNEKPEITQKLMFQPQSQQKAGDPDQSVMQKPSGGGQ
jgi:hypothetical protein